MIDVRYDGGPWLPECGLWLDPKGARDFAFVSHAHSDHTGHHRETLLTPGTARLMRARIGDGSGIIHELEFRQRGRIRDVDVMLIPAGHVLGSAQCWIGTNSGTLLYTGDFKLRRGLSAEAAEAEPAETLVMETTFGLPRYVFPPADEVIRDIVRFCVETLEDGMTPVLLAYSLGKAQEVLAGLAGAGLEAVLHGAVWKLTKVYENLGVAFPGHGKYGEHPLDGKVFVCPPNANGSAMLRKIGPRRVAALTGWALDPGAVHRMRCDAAFPLSDHADYPALLRHVEAVGARRVLTLHGFAQEFARDLRERGIEAWALTGANQLELPIARPAPQGAPPLQPGPAPLRESGFEGFCRVVRRLSALSGKTAKTRVLAEYFRSLDNRSLALATVWLSGSPFPRSDPRTAQIGWALIRRALLSVSGLTPSELSAISRRFNDAGRTAEAALAGSEPTGNPDLPATAALFDALAAARGPAAKSALLEARFSVSHPVASAMVVRILTGELRAGLKAGLVEEALAESTGCDPSEIREANMLLADLGETAARARAGTLGSAELQPFRPVACMLASPEPDAGAVWRRFAESPHFAGTVWLEDKLDGIRAQVHASAGRAEIFSRDTRPIRSAFPEIADAAKRAGRDFVLDGEIVAWSGGKALPFFDLQKRLGRKEPDLFLGDEIPVVFRAFDILRCDGRSLFREPLAARRATLESLALTEPLGLAPVVFAGSAAEIDRAFADARSRGNEGLIAKDPSSPYRVGRRGMAWIKLKKTFATLDAVVVAAEYGHGKRAAVLSDYTFAVADGRGGLAVIGKAYSGLSDAEIAELTTHFQNTTTRQRGRVYEVEPTVVLEIAFDSVQESARHPSGLALRFPRIKAIRRDKTPAEIDTIASARKLLPRPPARP